MVTCAGVQALISIHAPPRGATPRVVRRRGRRKYFNSRPSARGDRVRLFDSLPAPVFQFTPLREGRPLVARFLCLRHPYFNSRPSARGDVPFCVLFSFILYFNSRPSARGDSAAGSPTAHSGRQFQFTPLREGRPADSRRVQRLPFHFNSRPSARGDTAPQPTAGQQTDFNSRPSARGDGKRYAISANLLFNPYKSAWLNNSATQFVEIILVIFHRIIA